MQLPDCEEFENTVDGVNDTIKETTQWRLPIGLTMELNPGQCSSRDRMGKVKFQLAGLLFFLGSEDESVARQAP
jgi:hypothetical protein